MKSMADAGISVVELQNSCFSALGTEALYLLISFRISAIRRSGFKETSFRSSPCMNLPESL